MKFETLFILPRILIAYFFLFLTVLFSSCQHDEFDLNQANNVTTNEDISFKEGMTILGKQLENPYSIENMQKAYENLTSENQLKGAIKIEPTHLYVRFRPKNEKELDLIRRDRSLDFYNYPLDVEIKRGGTYYHDPSIPKTEITWQYTVVPANYIFPSVKYQVLSKLFLQEESGELNQLKSASMEYFDWIQLEEEALRITDNLPERTIKGSVLKSSSWRPSGTIKVRDDYLAYSQTNTRAVFDHWEYYDCFGEGMEPFVAETPQESSLKSASVIEPGDEPTEPTICKRAIYRYETVTTASSHLVPIEGVEVRARRWFTTHKGYVDSNGSFTCDGTFIYDANYSIEWERWDFDIRDGSYGQAYFNGPKQTGAWNLDIEKDATPKSFLFAHIFRGAYTYFYKHDNWGIKSPPERDGVFGFLQHRLHIAGRDEIGRSHYFTFNEFILAAQIVVYANYWDSREIFGTTIHELAHASHWEMGYTTGQYVLDALISDPKIPESWAVGVEWQITNDVYNWTFPVYNRYYQNYSIAEIIGNGGYTPLVIDLIDNNNQGTNISMPNDEVEGYSLSQIEYALSQSPGSWWSWRTNIKNLFYNSTEEHVDYLFQTYTN